MIDASEATRRRHAAGLMLPALALLAAGAAGAPARLVHDVNGYTCDAEGRLQSVAGLRIDAEGRIAAVWSSPQDRPADAQTAGGEAVIDGGGRTLLPGLIDAHGHVRALGEARQRVDLVGAGSLEEALARVQRYAEAHPAQPWIVGRGWNQEQWPTPRFPTAADLDAVVSDRPVFLQRIDGHAAWVNTRALTLAEVSAATDAPSGGRVVVDDTGAPTGILVDAAMQLVSARIPPPTPQDDARAILLALEELSRLGLTGAHDAGISASELETYIELARRGRLDVRIYAMLSEAARDALAEPILSLGADRLTVRSVKLYADGALGSRGAALLSPYADEPGNTGLAFKSQAEMDALVSSISARGFQVNVHAIGDAANRMVLDALARVPTAQRRTLRHRIEHAQIIHPADIPRFAALDVIASMQPTHATSDMFMAMKRLDASRLTGAYAWRRLLESGARVAAGSDFPVEPANPFFGIHAAVTRRNRDGEPAAGWRVDEALTRTEALCAFTTEAAFAGHAEDRVGRLAPGYWADFILVDRDPFAIDAQSLWEVQVLETWVAGERVYRREAPATGR